MGVLVVADEAIPGLLHALHADAAGGATGERRDQLGGVVNEVGIVDGRQRDSGLMRPPRVQAPPLPIFALNLVRDDQMGVTLRVGGS